MTSYYRTSKYLVLVVICCGKEFPSTYPNLTVCNSALFYVKNCTGNKCGISRIFIMSTSVHIIFVNGIPMQESSCEDFGFTNDFEFVATIRENMQHSIIKIRIHCLKTC